MTLSLTSKEKLTSNLLVLRLPNPKQLTFNVTRLRRYAVSPDGVETGRCTLNVNCIMAFFTCKTLHINTFHHNAAAHCRMVQAYTSQPFSLSKHTYLFSRLASTTPAHPSRGAGNKRTAHCRVRANLLKCRESHRAHTAHAATQADGCAFINDIQTLWNSKELL